MLGLHLSLAVSLSISGAAPVEPEPAAETLEPLESVDPDAWAELDGRDDAEAVRVEPSADGCTKDNDCKGDRICDASRCVAPAPTSAPAPRPPVRSVPVTMHHPYNAGGAAMIVFGTVGIVAGSIWIGVYRSKAKTLAEDYDPMVWDPAALDELTAHAAKAPRIHAGTGILISSCGVLLVAGIILAAIERPMRVSIRPSAGGLTLRF